MATKTSLLGLTKPAYTEAADIAVLNTNFDLIDKAVGQGARVKNLLDNSDFSAARFIAQAGFNVAHGATLYMGDRWMRASNIAPTSQTNGILVSCTDQFAFIQQRVTLTPGKKYTAVLSSTGGTANRRIAVFNTGLNEIFASVEGGDGLFVATFTAAYENMAILFYPAYVSGGGSAVFQWAALYEGAYTAETLPAYVYKGYAAELAECQRYYLHVGADSNAWIAGKYIIGWGLIVEFPVQMRTNGSVIKGDSGKIQAFSASGWEDVSASYVNVRGGTTYVCLSSPVNVSAGDSCLVVGIAGISADL